LGGVTYVYNTKDLRVINGKIVIDSALLAKNLKWKDEAALYNVNTQRFSTTDDAALAWSLRYASDSKKAGAEYGAFIYKNSDNKYYLGKLLTSGDATKIDGKVFWGGQDTKAITAGWVHTHGNTTGQMNWEFSGFDGDAGITNSLGCPGYLVNSKGELFVMSPNISKLYDPDNNNYGDPNYYLTWHGTKSNGYNGFYRKNVLNVYVWNLGTIKM